MLASAACCSDAQPRAEVPAKTDANAGLESGHDASATSDWPARNRTKSLVLSRSRARIRESFRRHANATPPPLEHPGAGGWLLAADRCRGQTVQPRRGL